jgi:hypothetical protein
MGPGQAVLLVVVRRIFVNGAVTTTERHQLAGLDRTDALTTPDVYDVFRAFLSETWGDVIDDTQLTVDERTRLAMIVRALALPDDTLPFAVDMEADSEVSFVRAVA